MKQSRIDLMRKIYAQNESHGEPLLVDPYADDISPDDCLTVQNDIDYLLYYDYIAEDECSTVSVYCLWLTEKGMSFVKNGCVDSPVGLPGIQQTPRVSINLSGAQLSNAVIGSTITGSEVTINAGASLTELKELIAQKAAEDQLQLQELLHELEQLQQLNQPVQRGWLARFSDVLQKHTDLIAPLATALLQHFLGR